MDTTTGILAEFADSDYTGGVHHAYTEITGDIGRSGKGRKRPRTPTEAMTRVMRVAFAKIGSIAVLLRLPVCTINTAKDLMCEFRDVWVRVRANTSCSCLLHPPNAGQSGEQLDGINTGGAENDDTDGVASRARGVSARAMPHDDAAMCVVLHAACAADGKPVSYAELAERTKVSRSKIAAARRAMVSVHPTFDNVRTEASGLAMRYSVSFSLPFSEERRAGDIAAYLEKGAFEGRPANVIALAALYLVLKNQPSYALSRQVAIADRLGAACFVAKKTARAVVNQLEENPALLASVSALQYSSEESVH